MITSKDRVLEIAGYVALMGKAKACEHYGLAESSINRYLREVKNIHGIELDKNIHLKQIAEHYTNKEIEAIAKGGRVLPGIGKVPVVNFNGDRTRVGLLGDIHFGSIYTDSDLVYQAYKEFEKEKVDFVVQVGDVTEGMSNRDGHVYELSHIGYTAQKKEAVQVLSDCPVPMYMIDGNHDRWFIKSNGAVIVEDICDNIEQATFLGHDEGDISLGGIATLKLWHGEDGNSYAISYRLQKIVEALTGGEKPHVMFCGHTHKSMYMYDRHIHVYSAGAMQKQTKWMRGKRIASHTGFWVVDIWANDSGVAKVRGTWYPLYI